MSEGIASQGHQEPLVRADEFIQRELRNRLEKLESHTSAHALYFNGPLYPGSDDIIRDLIESRRANGELSNRLVILLTSMGGQVGPVQRIAETIRHFYKDIWFVIPNHAYSAGTILAMSGDRIFMDYYSRLGPIDPQVPNSNGTWVPAIGYLRRWEALLEKANDGTITTAEVQIMLNFDQAELYFYEQAAEQSVELLKDWLANYKFRDWKKTQSQGLKVTKAMREKRAREIAEILSDSDRWHSHGHGISKVVLERDINLLIDDLEQDPELYQLVKQYDKLSVDYMRKMGANVSAHALESSLVLL